MKVYTFLSEGSFFRQYLSTLSAQRDDINLVIDALPERELRTWRKDVRSALTIRSITQLEDINFSHLAQKMRTKSQSRAKLGDFVGNALMNLRYRDEELKNVEPNLIGITCARDNWYSSKPGEKPTSSFWSKPSRLFGHAKRLDDGQWSTDGARWIANATRGTNKYSECTHAIYLYNQNPNPQVVNFLGKRLADGDNAPFSDHFALTELIQWLFRFQIRKGGYGRLPDGSTGFRGERLPTTVFLPSNRMRNLLINWLDSGVVSSAPPTETNARLLVA